MFNNPILLILNVNTIILLKYIYYKNKVKYNKKIVTNCNKIIIKLNNNTVIRNVINIVIAIK